jgi:Ca2+-binding RTX toxin-like protein
MAILMGTSGPDNLIGTLEADTIYGAAGNDTINGYIGNDKIYGELGNDSLRGSVGLDWMYGGEGNDTLDASGEGNDYLLGASGNDVYQLVRLGSVVIEHSNQGIDTIQSRVDYTLDAHVENLVLTGADHIDGTGNNLNNHIMGNSGNNTLSGLGGDDILNGGDGTDHFLFTMLPASGGIDTIHNFEALFGDKIVLNRSVFLALEAVYDNVLQAQGFSSINVVAATEQAVAASSNAEFIYNRETGNLFYNANDDGAGFGATGGQIATIVGSPDYLAVQDFRIIGFQL